MWARAVDETKSGSDIQTVSYVKCSTMPGSSPNARYKAPNANDGMINSTTRAYAG